MSPKNMVPLTYTTTQIILETVKKKELLETKLLLRPDCSQKIDF